jgi:DNA-binding SARP family transcriptional activator
MSTVRISLFRQFCVQRQKQPLPGLDSQKAQELLAYLLLYRQRPFTREQLASLLWPDTPSAQARQYLRQNLWQLQSAVGGNGQSPPNALISVEGDWIQASLASGAWLDVAEFENAYALVTGVPGKALNQNAAHQLQRAVELYRGDLLEEWYYDWCLFERERLQNIYFAVLDKLIAYCEATQAYEAGMDYGSEILRRDRARERTYRWLMHPSGSDFQEIEHIVSAQEKGFHDEKIAAKQLLLVMGEHRFPANRPIAAWSRHDAIAAKNIANGGQG